MPGLRLDPHQSRIGLGPDFEGQLPFLALQPAAQLGEDPPGQAPGGVEAGARPFSPRSQDLPQKPALAGSHFRQMAFEALQVLQLRQAVGARTTIRPSPAGLGVFSPEPTELFRQALHVAAQDVMEGQGVERWLFLSTAIPAELLGAAAELLRQVMGLLERKARPAEHQAARHARNRAGNFRVLDPKRPE